MVQRHFRGLVLDTSKNVVAFTCPDVEKLKCDWNISEALIDLIADDLRGESSLESMPEALQTKSEQAPLVVPNEAIQVRQQDLRYWTVSTRFP